MKIIKILSIGAVILATLAVSSPRLARADVVIGTKAWRQVTDTTNVSWNNLDVIYDTTTGELDTGTTTAGGHEFSGWTWASAEDVAAMFTESDGPGGLSITHPGTVLEDNSSWAPAFLAMFNPTWISSNFDTVWGLSRTLDTPTTVFAPRLFNENNPPLFTTDGATTSQITVDTGDRFTTIGVWLYQVPEPSLHHLLGIALVGIVGVGVVRKIKQKKVTNS